MNRHPIPDDGTSGVAGDISCPPLIVTGMHRSGTSLTASLLASAGLHVGERLLGAYSGNPLGHFEDLDFLEFHIRVLRGVGDDENGYTANPVRGLPAHQIAQADALVADRSASARLWGWKDPRTTLFLDFWAERLPNARYLFVFRNAADVADSLFRRGDWWFVHQPIQALQIWRAYNQLIVDFASRHFDRCCVIEIDDLIRNATATLKHIRSKLGLSLGDPATMFRPDLFGKDSNPRGEAITMTIAPEVNEIYTELRRLSERDSPRRSPNNARPISRSPAPPIGDPTTHKLIVHEWARGSRAEAAVRDACGKEAVARDEVTRLSAELAAATDRIQRLKYEHATAVGNIEQLNQRIDESHASNQRLEEALAAATLQATQAQEALAAASVRNRYLEESLWNMTTARQRLEQELAEARAWLPSRYTAVMNWIRNRLGLIDRTSDAEAAPETIGLRSQQRKVA